MFGSIGPDDPAARRLVKQTLALALRLKGLAERDMRPAAQFFVNRLKEFSGESGLFAWAAGELQDLRARAQRADEQRAAKAGPARGRQGGRPRRPGK